MQGFFEIIRYFIIWEPIDRLPTIDVRNVDLFGARHLDRSARLASHLHSLDRAAEMRV